MCVFILVQSIQAQFNKTIKIQLFLYLNFLNHYANLEIFMLLFNKY